MVEGKGFVSQRLNKSSSCNTPNPSNGLKLTEVRYSALQEFQISCALEGSPSGLVRLGRSCTRSLRASDSHDLAPGALVTLSHLRAHATLATSHVSAGVAGSLWPWWDEVRHRTCGARSMLLWHLKSSGPLASPG